MEMSELLGTELGAEVPWAVVDNEIPDSGMAKCFAESWQIHKDDNYISVYDAKFAPYRLRKIRMLEIGVSRGGSLEMWRKYFTPDSVIVGVDQNPACAQFNDPERNLYVRIGDQQDTAFLQQVIDEFGPFDIILDDGSHLPSPTLKSFQHLFPRGLVDGGVYLVEDLWYCYMFPAGQEDGWPTFVDVVKDLIDVMHRHWAKAFAQSEEGCDDQHYFGTHSDRRIMEHLVPLATTLIDRIDLYDSIVAIHRNAHDPPRVIMNTSGEF
jgi:hypothetical protein